MTKISVTLSTKVVPAVDGLIGVQTLLDGKPYYGQADVIKVGDVPVVIFNGPLDDEGVMQMPEVSNVE